MIDIGILFAPIAIVVIVLLDSYGDILDDAFQAVSDFLLDRFNL